MVVRPRLDYLDIVKARGNQYAYYRRSGRRHRIEGDIGSSQWLAEYSRIHATFEANSGLATGSKGSLAALIEDYLRTDRFRCLKEGSKARYRISLDKLRSNLGSVQIRDLTRGNVVRLRDTIAAKSPKEALEIVKMIRLIYEHAFDCDLVDRNPASGVADPITYDPIPHRPWTAKEIETFKARAKPIYRRAMMVLLHTGLRRADAIALKRSDIVDGVIPWQVEKTKTDIIVPITAELAKELERPLPVESLHLICGVRGHKLSGTALSNGISRQCARLGFDPTPPLHGLRKNAVMNLLEHGCTEEMVNAITGQSKEMIRHYGQDFDRRRLAKAAVLKLEGQK